jgi:hypothetical protein
MRQLLRKCRIRTDLISSRSRLAHPEARFYTVELETLCYPHLRRIERWHRWRICLAARRFAIRIGKDKYGVLFAAKEE